MVIAEYNWIVMAGRGFSFHPAGVAAQPTEPHKLNQEPTD